MVMIQMMFTISLQMVTAFILLQSDIESIYNGMKLNDLNLNPMEVFE